MSRSPLPDRRRSVTHRLRVGNQAVFFTVGYYPDGSPGELFIDLSKQGTALRAWGGAAALLFSLCLQYGAPPEELVDALEGLNSEPFGTVPVEGHPAVTQATGVLDAIVRVLRAETLPAEVLSQG